MNLSISPTPSRLWASLNGPVNLSTLAGFFPTQRPFDTSLLSLRSPGSFAHYLGMEEPTLILVGTGIVFGAFATVWTSLKRRYKERPRPEDRHDRAERREMEWYPTRARMGKKDREESGRSLLVK
jgi:hypothetical protein